MTTYKATVKDKETKQYTVISGEYSSKAAFIKDLRRNGYAVNVNKVKKADVYDAIIKYTDCDDDAWAICNTVEDAMDIFAAYERYFEKREKMYNEKYGEDKEEQPTVETAKEQPEDKKEYTLFISDNFTFTVYEIEQGHQLRQVYSYGVQRLENLYDVYWELLKYDKNVVKCYLESEQRFIDADLFIPLIWVYKHTKDDEQQLWKDRFKENKYTAIQKATEIYQAFQIAAGADLVREELTK